MGGHDVGVMEVFGGGYPEVVYLQKIVYREDMVGDTYPRAQGIEVRVGDSPVLVKGHEEDTIIVSLNCRAQLVHRLLEVERRAVPLEARGIHGPFRRDSHFYHVLSGGGLEVRKAVRLHDLASGCMRSHVEVKLDVRWVDVQDRHCSGCKGGWNFEPSSREGHFVHGARVWVSVTVVVMGGGLLVCSGAGSLSALGLGASTNDVCWCRGPWSVSGGRRGQGFGSVSNDLVCLHSGLDWHSKHCRAYSVEVGISFGTRARNSCDHGTWGGGMVAFDHC